MLKDSVLVSFPQVFVVGGAFMCNEPDGVRVALDGTPGTVLVRPKMALPELGAGQRVGLVYTVDYIASARDFSGKAQAARVGLVLTAISVVEDGAKAAASNVLRSPAKV